MNIFVTGGSRGIGAAIVRAAVERGHHVAFTYRESRSAADDLRGWAEERAVPCRSYALDVRDGGRVDAVAEEVVDDFGEIHAVIANAGVNKNGLAVSLPDGDWQEVLDTNLTGAFRVARAFLPHFLSRRSGRFVFMSSLGHRGVTGQVAYAASKAGLLGLSATLAKEYGPRGITSNCLVPGLFDTDMTRDGASESNVDFWRRYCPLRRLGELDELAGAALFLLSTEAAFINGQAIALDGGLDFAP